MKFLCVSCDEQMVIGEARGPDEGSMSVLFACPGCGWDMAMLTNPLETQMVRSLNVNIGAHPEDAAGDTTGGDTTGGDTAGGDTAGGDTAGGDAATGAPADASGCPLSGTVAEAHAGSLATAPAGPPPWTPEAEERLGRVPDFVRSMARKSIERFASERGHDVITGEVMNLARSEVGM